MEGLNLDSIAAFYRNSIHVLKGQRMSFAAISIGQCHAPFVSVLFGRIPASSSPSEYVSSFELPTAKYVEGFSK